MSLKATLGAIRAAWKSIECGIEPPFFSVNSTVWPSRTWTIGSGAPSSNAQTLYSTPGAGAVLHHPCLSRDGARGDGREGRVVGLGGLRELGRFLGHDACEALERERRVVVAGVIVAPRCRCRLARGGRLGARVGPQAEGEQRDDGDPEAEQEGRDLEEHA